MSRRAKVVLPLDEGVASDVVLGCADYLAQPMTPQPGKKRWCSDQRVEDPERDTPFILLPWTVRAIVSGMLVLALLLAPVAPASAADLDWWGKTKITLSGWYAKARAGVGWGWGPYGPNGDHQVVLAWDAYTDAPVTGFKMYYGTSSGTYTAHDDIVDPNATEHTVTGLDNDKTYYFAITAYDETTESGYSNEVYTLP